MKTLKKISKWFLIICLTLFLLPIVLFGIVSFFVLPPEKLTPVVTELVNKQIEATFESSRIELTLFSTYPNIGLKITDGKLTNLPKDNVTAGIPMLSFSKAILSFRLIDFLIRDQIVIHNFAMDQVDAKASFDANNKSNWDILPTHVSDTTVAAASSFAIPTMKVKNFTLSKVNLSYDNEVSRQHIKINRATIHLSFNLKSNKAVLSNTVSSDSVQNTPSFKLPVIELKNLSIDTAQLQFDDFSNDRHLELENLFTTLSGHVSDSLSTIAIDLGWKSLQFKSKEYILENTLDLDFKTQISLSDTYTKIKFTQAEVLVNKIPFSVEGSIVNNPQSIDMDLKYDIKIHDLNHILDFVPKKYLAQLRGFKPLGNLDFKGKIYGRYTNASYPVITSTIRLKNASLKNKQGYGFHQIEWDVDTRLDMAHNNSTYVDLKKVLVKSRDTSLDIKAKITDLLINPTFDGTVKSDINFTNLTPYFFSPDTLVMKGDFHVDIKTKVSINDVKQGNYGKIKATGDLDIKNIKVFSAPYKIDIDIEKANTLLTTDRKMSSKGQEVSLISGKLAIEKLIFKYGTTTSGNIRNLKFSAGVSSTIDTVGIIPMGGQISFDRLRTILPDSSVITVKNAKIRTSMTGTPENKKKPTFSLGIISDTLSYRIRKEKTSFLLIQSNLKTKVFPYKKTERKATTRVLTQAQRDSIKNVRKLNPRDTSLVLTGENSELLTNWDISGQANFNQLKIRTPYFPIPMILEGSTLNFTSQEIELSGAKLQLGKSDLQATGKLSNIRRILTRGGILKVELSALSNYIDTDELLDAMSKGVLYSEQRELYYGKSVQDSIKISASIPVEESVFMTPPFLDLKLISNAKEIKFKHLNLENVLGELTMCNKSLNIRNLSTSSNLGKGKMNLFYKAENPKEANAGFETDLENILVDKLIDLVPSIDTLFPMMRSFEGIVDCKMATTFKLDSTMSVIIPSIEATADLEGENLVVLDDEVFTEISKRLMFKNKKRNVIDHMAVELMIQDNKVEIFPFLLEIDRYRVAIGGTHNLDMSFNYHISVLKSPIPFKLGIDITGTIDQYKYRITTCKYKDLFTTAKKGTIDTTRINLKNKLYKVLHQRIYQDAPINSQVLNKPTVKTPTEAIKKKSL